jgi:tryptophanase
MARGGLIATNRKDLFEAIRPWLPVYEGFFTYGGMSSKEIEAMAVGMREMTELEIAGSGADAIKYFVGRLGENGVPVVTPPGGLACHLDAGRFVSHLQPTQYPAGALAAAVYITAGIRGMERGTLSMDRDEQGNDVPSDMELLRLAVPRRVFTMSHFEYATDRLKWLHEHRDLVGGIEFFDEPPVLRFFGGRLKPKGNWGAALAAAFEKDFGPDC